MKRLLLGLFLLHTISFSQQPEVKTDSIKGGGNTNNEFTSYIKEHSEKHYSGDVGKNYPRIDKLVTAGELGVADPFNWVVRDNRYALLSDIDGDKNKELIFLQVEGTGYYPHFYICRYDSLKKKFRISKHIKDKFLYPLTFNDHLYFIDIAKDYNSKRLAFITAYDINKQLNLVKQFSLKANYSYQIPDSLQPYVKNDFIESLPTFKLRHLSKRKFLTFNKDKYYISFDNKDTIKYNISYTSVGYNPSTITLELESHNGMSLNSKDIFGFDIVPYNGKRFLVISEFDDRGRFLGMHNMKISVISFSTLKVLLYGYLNANVSLSSAP